MRTAPGQRQWMPLSVLILGLLSILMLIWSDRISELQRMNFDLADALMDIQINVVTSHLWMEEAIRGENPTGFQIAGKNIDLAIALAGAVLTGRKYR